MQRRQFIKGVGVAMGAAFSSHNILAAERPATPGRSVHLDAQALEDTMLGSSYLGCGGGGSLQAARELIRSDLAAGFTFQLLDVADLGNDEWVASPYALESLAPMDDDMRARLDRVGVPLDVPVIN